jgi:hypothetical protein
VLPQSSRHAPCSDAGPAGDSWANKDDLVLAAIRHYSTTHFADIHDTGSLHGDMIALLGSISSTRVSFIVTIGAVFSGLPASTGLVPAQVREKVLADR